MNSNHGFLVSEATTLPTAFPSDRRKICHKWLKPLWSNFRSPWKPSDVNWTSMPGVLPLPHTGPSGRICHRLSCHTIGSLSFCVSRSIVVCLWKTASSLDWWGKWQTLVDNLFNKPLVFKLSVCLYFLIIFLFSCNHDLANHFFLQPCHLGPSVLIPPCTLCELQTLNRMGTLGSKHTLRRYDPYRSRSHSPRLSAEF